jgi:pyruvate oxidase
VTYNWDAFHLLIRNRHPKVMVMARWKCTVCGYVYDEDQGEPRTGTPPHTGFEDLPGDWLCPVCGAPTSAFIPVSEGNTARPVTGESRRWRCTVCGYVYDEVKGEPATGTTPGTPFADLSDDWLCPVCGSAKSVFVPLPGDEVHEASPTTVSEVIVSELEKWGVELVFGIPGTSSLGLLDAVRKSDKIRYIAVRHEENAAMAASAYHKLTGKIAVCLTIAGPGATNLATGLYDAKEDGASVLSLNGQVEKQYTGPYGIQEIDQDAFFRSVTVYNNTVYERNMAVLLLTKALKFAILERGVGQLSVPNDVQKQTLDIAYSRRESCVMDFPILPDPALIRGAAEAIGRAKKPVIIAGWGAYMFGEQVAELARRISAPILTTYRAKGILPEDHEWVVGVLGNVGAPQARKLVEDADLIITLGVGFSKFTNVPTDRTIVQVDINPLKLGKGSDSISLWGNAGLVIPRLIEDVSPRSDPAIPELIRKMKEEWDAQRDREADPEAVPLRPPYIMKVLSETVPDDAIIAVDVGENQWWFGRNFRIKRQRFTMSGYLATMGYGFPAAIAGQLAYPEKKVICITGDGGFAMAMADFVTAVKYQLPIVVVVLNNGQLGMIQVEQMVEHYPNFATDLHNPDFAAYAEACGGAGIRVGKPGELRGAVEQALQSRVPVIVDIATDPKRFG